MKSGNKAVSLPHRPALTPVLGAALVYWLSCATAYTLLKAIDAQGCRVLFIAASMALALSLVLLVRFKGTLGAIVAVACALGLLSAGVRAGSLHELADTAGDADGERIEVVFADDARASEFGARALCYTRIGGRTCKATLLLGPDGNLWRCGQRAAFRASVTAVNLETDDFNWNRGVVLKARPQGRLEPVDEGLLEPLVSFRSACIEQLAGDDGPHALLQALVCGYRPQFAETEDYAAFQKCGLAHLVAVSGAHLVIVVGFVLSVLNALRIPRPVCVAISAVIMLCYLVVSGVPVSALRACFMSLVSLASLFGKRRSSSANALGLGIFVLVGAQPETSVSVSFALSALSTLGIVAFSPLFTWHLSNVPVLSHPVVRDPLALTCAASLLSLPYSCSVFSVIPLVAPLANVATTPLFPLVCVSGLVSSLAAFAGCPGASLAVDVSVALSGMLDSLVKLLACIPHASVPFAIDTMPALAISALSALVCWVGWTRLGPGRVAVIVAVVVIAFTLTARVQGAGDVVAMLDVGQGDAMLVRSGGATMLVDTGNQDSKLAEALARQRVSNIDVLLVTHADDDHRGSMDVLRRSFSVKRVVLAADMLTCGDEACESLVSEARTLAGDVVGLEVGDRFRIGAFEVRVVWPHRFADDGGNADSLGVVMSYDGDGDGEEDLSVLAAGDAERDELAAMIDDGSVGNVDILKVGHHGSRNALDEQQAQLLSPSIALIGVGLNNRYGHPTVETLGVLEKAGSKVFRTDTDGTIVCRLHAGGVSVSTMQ